MLTTVQDILRIKGSQVWSITPETTVIEALQILAKKELAHYWFSMAMRLWGLSQNGTSSGGLPQRSFASWKNLPVR